MADDITKVVRKSFASWGTELVFRVDSKTVQTFSGFKREVSASWAKHPRIGGKDRSEFLRPNPQQVTMTAIFDASLFMDLDPVDRPKKYSPRTQLDTIAAAIENGKTNFLIINGQKVGSNRFAITSAGEAWQHFTPDGKLIRAEVELTLEEYL